jgi:hypothetical protein
MADYTFGECLVCKLSTWLKDGKCKDCQEGGAVTEFLKSAFGW